MIYTVRTLIAYILCGVLFSIPLVLYALPALFKNDYALRVLYSINVCICSICHNTRFESISGRSWRHRYDKRYWYLVRVIDWLSRSPGHCERADKWERDRFKMIFK